MGNKKARRGSSGRMVSCLGSKQLNSSLTVFEWGVCFGGLTVDAALTLSIQ